MLAGCHGPIEVQPKKEQIDKAVVEVSCQPVSGRAGQRGARRSSLVSRSSLPKSSSSAGIHEAELEEFVQRCAEHAVLTQQHPRTAITIVEQAYEADGSMLATSINAACLALLSAAVAMRHLVVAVGCAVQSDGSLLLDPTSLEEKVTFHWRESCVCIDLRG